MDFENSQYYTNRELSWIQFNYRVLEEARDKSNPLFERLKFLSITSSNLDEFFMVRVASLKDMVNAGYKKPDIAGMTPKEQLSAISEALHEFTQTQYSTYNRSLLPLLAKEHITVLTSFEQMNDEEASFADNFFMEKVYPVLTPMAVDASRPFPLIRNKSLNIAALIKTKNQSEEEMEPELATFTKYVDGQQYGVAEFDTPDFLLNTVAGIHELPYFEDVPAFLQGYELQNFYSLDILFVDDTGKAHYEDTCSYLIVEASDLYYLLEIGPNSQIEKILEEGQISNRDDALAYEITEDAYAALDELFIKP